jgi:hypothetical protein
MYKLLIVLVAAVLLSLGLAYPELILHQTQIDSTLILQDDALPQNTAQKQFVPDYDVPRPDGDPLPPPPDDDDEVPKLPLGDGN